jgi:hypothetical protein
MYGGMEEAVSMLGAMDARLDAIERALSELSDKVSSN